LACAPSASCWRLWATGRATQEDTNHGIKKMIDITTLAKRLRAKGEWSSDKKWDSDPDATEAADALEAQAKDAEAEYVRRIKDARIAGLDAACERLIRGE
jgi:hypothetical protein